MNFAKPKYYANANLKQKPDYYDYENYEIQYGDLNNYEILCKIGRGKYSDIYEGVNMKNKKEKIIIKVLKPVRQKKIKREIKILHNLNNHPNIIKLYDVVKDPSSKTTSLIFENVQNIDYKQLYSSINENELKFIMHSILQGLNYAHSQGIIHRDIKPHNIMVNMEEKEVKIIDWGLSEFYFPGKDYNVRVASRYFKSPELLLNYNYYDYSLDIWSLGCMFAGIIFQKEPFFMGNNNQDQLEKITKVLGTEGLIEYINNYQIELDPEITNNIDNHPKISFIKFISPKNNHLANSTSIDLLSKMLIYDHTQRITAQDALNHPYFQNFKKEE